MNESILLTDSDNENEPQSTVLVIPDGTQRHGRAIAVLAGRAMPHIRTARCMPPLVIRSRIVRDTKELRIMGIIGP